MIRAHKFGLTKKEDTCNKVKKSIINYYCNLYLSNSNLMGVFINVFWLFCLYMINIIYGTDARLPMNITVALIFVSQLLRPYLCLRDNIFALHYSLHYLKYFPLTVEELKNLHITTKMEYTVFVNLFMAVPSWLSGYSFKYHLADGIQVLEAQQNTFDTIEIKDWIEMRNSYSGIDMVYLDDYFCKLGTDVLRSLQSCLGYFNSVSVLLKAFVLFSDYDKLNLYTVAETDGEGGVLNYACLKSQLISREFYDKTLFKYIGKKHIDYDLLGTDELLVEAVKKIKKI